jgi:PAS domain S-box-containing protein
LEALDIVRNHGLDAPFIVVSGHIGEDIAVASMKAGADDYVMKDRLARLVPSVRRALDEAEIRRAHKRANEALRESEERFRQLAENIGAAFFIFENPEIDPPGTISYASPAFAKIWGYPRESLFRNPRLWIVSIHPQDRQQVLDNISLIAKGNFNEEFRIVRMDLKVRWVQYRTFPVRNDEGIIYRVAAIAEDITERKLAQEQLALNARQLQKTVDDLRRTEEELRQRNSELSTARSELEQRVQERTADLTAANSELQCQIVERKRLENELLEIAENERRRIGFDLHDDLGQKLMAVSLMLKAVERNLTAKNSDQVEDLKGVETLIQQIINHTHNLAHCFSSLEAQGDDLGGLVEKLAGNVRETFNISCRFKTVGDIPELPADATNQLYKIAQESISNAIKHGKARWINILLARQNGVVVLRIKNDGVPFPVDLQPNNRLGLRIMNYRAHLVGATFEICPNGECGTLVSCTLPAVTNGRLPYSRLASPGYPLGNGKSSELSASLLVSSEEIAGV